MAEVEGEARDPAGDRRHRLRRARDVALPPLRALLRRDRRDARAPGVAGRAGLEDHRQRDPDRPGLRAAEGQGRDAQEVRPEARPDHHPGLGRRVRRRPDRRVDGVALRPRAPGAGRGDLRAEREAQGPARRPGRPGSRPTPG